MVGTQHVHLDHTPKTGFKGFAVANWTDKEICVVVNSESEYPKEFLLRPREVYYPNVGAIVNVLTLDDAKKLYITKHLEDIVGK